MTTIDQSAETVSTVEQVVESTVLAMFSSPSHLRRSSPLTNAGHTGDLMTYGCLRFILSDSVLTETQQLSPWILLPPGAALQQAIVDVRAILDTPTSGGLAMLVFATPLWRLLITTKSSAKPPQPVGVALEYEFQETTLMLSAKLFAQRPGDSSIAQRVWHAAVPAAEDAAISQFLSTVLSISLRPSTAGPTPAK